MEIDEKKSLDHPIVEKKIVRPKGTASRPPHILYTILSYYKHRK